MSEEIVVLRKRQICDLCGRIIEYGERARLIRDDFWPMQVWFEHISCNRPGTAVPAEPVLTKPTSKISVNQSI